MVNETVLHIITSIILLVVFGLLVFMVLILLRRRTIFRSRKFYRRVFNDFVSEVVICETETELRSVLEFAPSRVKKGIQDYYGRRVLLDQLVETKVHLVGQAAHNLHWLYQHLELYKESLEKFYSRKWHRKAAGIQQLARMQHKDSLRRVYKATDHKNTFVRSEAQLAVVAFAGFEGLRFLNFITTPLSRWQQFSLLLQIPEQMVASKRIIPWLYSDNPGVQEFALRLVEKYRCFDLQHEVLSLVTSPHPGVRHVVLEIIEDMMDEHAADFMMKKMDHLLPDEQLVALGHCAEWLTDRHRIRLQQLAGSNHRQVAAYARTLLAGITVQATDLIYLPLTEKEII